MHPVTSRSRDYHYINHDKNWKAWDPTVHVTSLRAGKMRTDRDTSPVFYLIVVNEEYDRQGHIPTDTRARPDTRWAISNIPATYFPLTQPEAHLNTKRDHKFLPAAAKCRFKSRHTPIISALCKRIFGKREAFWLENNSRVKYERTTHIFFHTSTGESTSWSHLPPYDNHPKQCQSAI